MTSTGGGRLFAAGFDALNWIGERFWLGELRRRLVADLPGVVVEVGGGTGANLPYYASAARVVAVEPSAAMRSRMTGRLDRCPAPVEVVDGVAERLSVPDGSADAVVVSMVLCSVTDPDAALAEIRRALAPGGVLAVLEHVRADRWRGHLQDVVAPLWRRVGAGCNPNRSTVEAIESAGFGFDCLELLVPRPNVPVTVPFVLGRARIRPRANDHPTGSDVPRF
jgi:ubiquinone/menaquinone biosynthesis C-methylase UbiE